MKLSPLLIAAGTVSACQKTLFDTLAEVKEDAKTSKPDLRLYSLYAWVRFAL